MGLLNLGSLILGLIAWILPVVNLVQHKKVKDKRLILFSLTSVSACAISLCMQIFYTDYLVNKEDWSALMDTSNAVALVSALLFLVTIILNAVALNAYFKEKVSN